MEIRQRAYFRLVQQGRHWLMVLQFRAELTEQTVSGQPEVKEQFGVSGIVEVDPVGQTLSQGFGMVGSVYPPDDTEGVGLRNDGHGAPLLKTAGSTPAPGGTERATIVRAVAVPVPIKTRQVIAL
jgi:hypothetical protein